MSQFKATGLPYKQCLIEHNGKSVGQKENCGQTAVLALRIYPRESGYIRQNNTQTEWD